MKEDPVGLWKIAGPEKRPRAETAGLDKEEADFVSKYLALADELLKPPSIPNAAGLEEQSSDKSSASKKKVA